MLVLLETNQYENILQIEGNLVIRQYGSVDGTLCRIPKEIFVLF